MVSRQPSLNNELRMVRRGISYRRLVATDLGRICEIDRTEEIEVLLVQHGSELEERIGDWSAPAWSSDGQDRKSTRLNSSHIQKSRMPSSA